MEEFLGLLVTSIIGVRVIPDFVSLVVFIRFRKRHGNKKNTRVVSLTVSVPV